VDPLPLELQQAIEEGELTDKQLRELPSVIAITGVDRANRRAVRVECRCVILRTPRNEVLATTVTA
jgi:hypothetical protein